jgi:hypothetical protein
MAFPHPPGDQLDAIETADDESDDYMALADHDELDGIPVEDVLSDRDAPIPIEVNGRKYLSTRVWRVFLREKEALAQHRARQVKSVRADVELERQMNWTFASAYRAAAERRASPAADA